MQYAKNIAFTRLIKADGHSREFNFRRKHLAHEAIYDIDVSDDRGNRHYVSLQRLDGIWTIREKEVPRWIKELSLDFHTAIEEKETGDGPG